MICILSLQYWGRGRTNIVQSQHRTANLYLLFLGQQNVNQEYGGKTADQIPDVMTLNVPSSFLPQLTLCNALHRTKVWPRF